MTPSIRLRALALALFFVTVAVASPAASNLLWKVRNVEDLSGWNFRDLRPGLSPQVHPNGGVTVPCGFDSSMTIPVSVRAEDYPTLVLDMTIEETTLPNERLVIYWMTTNTNVTVQMMHEIDVREGQGGLLWVDLSSHPYWNGDITAMRIDPLLNDGDVVIRGIGLLTTLAPGVAPPAGSSRPGPTIAQPPDGAQIPPGRMLSSAPPGPPAMEWHFARDGESFGWRFYDEEGSTYGNEKRSYLTANGITLVCTEVDPQFRLEGVDWSAEQFSTLVVELEIKRLGIEEPAPYFTMFWSHTPEHSYFPEDGLFVPIDPGAGFRQLVVDLKSSPSWEGRITSLRIDPTDNAAVEATIRRIALYQ